MVRPFVRYGRSHIVCTARTGRSGSSRTNSPPPWPIHLHDRHTWSRTSYPTFLHADEIPTAATHERTNSYSSARHRNRPHCRDHGSVTQYSTARRSTGTNERLTPNWQSTPRRLASIQRTTSLHSLYRPISIVVERISVEFGWVERERVKRTSPLRTHPEASSGSQSVRRGDPRCRSAVRRRP